MYDRRPPPSLTWSFHVPTPADDRPDLLTVIAYMRAVPGKREAFRAALESLVEPTRQEKGCVNYDLYQSIQDPDLFFFYENWESEEDLDAHLAAPHMQQVGATLREQELLDGSGSKLSRVRRIA